MFCTAVVVTVPTVSGCEYSAFFMSSLNSDRRSRPPDNSRSAVSSLDKACSGKSAGLFVVTLAPTLIAWNNSVTVGIR